MSSGLGVGCVGLWSTSIIRTGDEGEDLTHRGLISIRGDRMGEGAGRGEATGDEAARHFFLALGVIARAVGLAMTACRARSRSSS